MLNRNWRDSSLSSNNGLKQDLNNYLDINLWRMSTFPESSVQERLMEIILVNSELGLSILIRFMDAEDRQQFEEMLRKICIIEHPPLKKSFTFVK